MTSITKTLLEALFTGWANGYPTKGDSWELGVSPEAGIATVLDFGPWADIKARWPEVAAQTVAELPDDVPEEKLGRTWVIQNERDGVEHIWLAGRGVMDLIKSTNLRIQARRAQST